MSFTILQPVLLNHMPFKEIKIVTVFFNQVERVRLSVITSFRFIRPSDFIRGAELAV